MPRFPRKEADFERLVNDLIGGLTKLAKDFPSPPVQVARLQELLADFRKRTVAAHEADAVAKAAHTAKDKVQRELVEATKADLEYAGALTRLEPLKLLELGWRPKRTRHSRHMVQPPGQVLNVTVASRGMDWVVLEWHAPADAGKVAFYVIQRRPHGKDADWESVGSATEPRFLLKNQPLGVRYEFQVFAENQLGAGTPGNVVMVAL